MTEEALRLARSAKAAGPGYDDLVTVLTEWRDMHIDIVNQTNSDTMQGRWTAIDVSLERVCGPLGSHNAG